MKKFLLVVLFMALTTVCYGAVQPTHITYGTAVYNSTEAFVITFNTVTSHIEIINLSQSDDVYVDLRCIDRDDNTGYATEGTVGLLRLGESGGSGNTDNTISIDYSTMNIGFIGEASGEVEYRITGDSKLTELW